MKHKRSIFGVKDRKKFFRELALSKKQNFEDNMRFVKLHAEWLKRTSNKEWSKQQKMFIDSIYKRNRHLKLNQA